MNRIALFATSIAIAIAAAASFAPASAMDSSRGSNSLERIPYDYLGTLRSVGPTTRDAFALAVSPYLHGYAEKTNTESCGEIARDAQHHYALIWGTNHSHLGCIIPDGNVPSGYDPTGVTIHAHPVRPGFRMTVADVVLGQFGAVGRYVGLFADTPSHFSATDYQGGAGYLATPNGSIYQNGSRSSTTVITGTPCQVVLRQQTSHYLASL